MPRQTDGTLWLAVLAAITLSVGSWWSVGLHPQAEAQEAKRFLYKVVDVPPDNAAIQATLNEYGAAGWDLVVVGMGDMTTPRLIFRK